MNARMAELCAGYGGLYLSLVAAGYDVELAWYAENDPDASAVMAHHHPDVPNLGDITTVDWGRAEPVDVLAAGYPCQDLSNADRDTVWPQHVRLGARRGPAVAGDDREGSGGLSLLPTPTASVASRGGMPAPGREGTNDLREAVALLLPTPAARVSGRGSGYTDESGRPLSETVPTPTATNRSGNTENNRGEQLLPGVVVDDARWLQYGPAIRRWERILGRPAPDPTTPGRRGAPRLSAGFVEWLMGLPVGYVTDVLDRNPALRVLGNGVIPAQGAAAYRALAGVADV